ncbi:MAG: hypothetical protein HQL27_01535 [Candidatus Omnitrophica bacterium]|nr:hypothetical protein [Candidatus Omnitrophota bacterium]
MVYLLIGEDNSEKDKIISEFKDKVFSSPGILNFDYEVLRFPKLEPAELKKSLVSLPAISEKRLVVIRGIEKLGAKKAADVQCRQILLNYFDDQNKKADVILDFFGYDKKNSFLSALRIKAKTIECGIKKAPDAFEVGRAIEKGDAPRALEILNELFSCGEAPASVIGALIWSWTNEIKRKIPKSGYIDGLEAIQKADHSIKRGGSSGLAPTEAVEILVVKLSSLAI